MEITLFEKPKDNGPLSKTIALGPDGKPVSDGSSCIMTKGTAKTVATRDVGRSRAPVGVVHVATGHCSRLARTRVEAEEWRRPSGDGEDAAEC